jgi:hypothetical protein
VKKQVGITKREVVNGYHQKQRSKWVSSKGEEVNEWVSSKGKEVNEWVSSKGKEVNGYHQKGRK